MGDELLSEILEVEREVRQQVDALEAETAERLAALGRELESALEAEADLLRKELARSLEAAELSARREATAILEEANAFRERLGRLGDDELDVIVVRHLERIRPEIDHDRQDEQA